MKKSSNIRRLLTILIIIVSAMFIVTKTTFGYKLLLYVASYIETIQEKKVRESFYVEVKNIPEIQVQKFDVMEHGIGYGDIYVQNKGKISIYYYGEKWISVRGIDNFSQTNISCGQGTSSILFGKGNLKEWFPFEISNLQQLVNHYDEIVAILNKLSTTNGFNSITSKINPDCSLQFNRL